MGEVETYDQFIELDPLQSRKPVEVVEVVAEQWVVEQRLWSRGGGAALVEQRWWSSGWWRQKWLTIGHLRHW